MEDCPVCGERPSRATEVDRAGRVAVCGSCGSWYRVPRPTPDELAKIYTQEYYDAWGLNRDETIAEETKLATFDALLRTLEGQTGEPEDRRPRLLDVGAATGLLLAAARRRGWEPFAVELNPYSAGVLRDRLGADRVFEGELTACSFPPRSFDAITMTDLIEHVPDIGATLRKAADLLRPGGVLCVTTPRIDSFSRVLMGRRWPHFKEEHLHYFTKEAFENVLSSTGFEVTQITGHTKRLSLEYLHTQFQTYRHWLLTPTVGLFRRAVPGRIRRAPMSYRWGEMLVLAIPREAM